MTTIILWFAVGAIAYGFGVAKLTVGPTASRHSLRHVRFTSFMCALTGPIYLAVLLMNGGTAYGWKL